MSLRKIFEDINIGLSQFLIASAIFMLMNIHKSNAQKITQTYTLKVCIIDSAASPIKNASLKITPIRQSLILAYQQLYDTSCTYITFNSQVSDTVVLHLSESHYAATLDTLILAQWPTAQISKVITLYSPHSTLENVTITAPPVWQRGDTTFHRADAFKQTGDRKLKDIITRMPGFEINEEGKLLYKKQVVSKMTIDGEEIFSEKLELLLNSFPLHVLDNVQAIENQTNNPMLKGLNNEFLIFVNLALKKENLKAAFGDGEAGMGTQGRYVFNPVIFGLFNRIKTGFIANYNSLGTGFNWSAEAELKNQQERQSEQWMMRQSLIVLNNFDARRYIRNRLFDNRLQVNIPISKALSLKNEISITTDRQRQNRSMVSQYASADSITRRNETAFFEKKPLFVTAKSQLDKTLSDNASVRFIANYYGNYGNSIEQAILVTGNILADTLQEQLMNGHHSLNARIEYTKRISANKGSTTYLQANSQWYMQQATAQRTDISSFYGVGNKYNMLEHTPDLVKHEWEAGSEWLTKPKKVLRKMGLTAQYSTLRFTNSTQFNNSAIGLLPQPFAPLNYNFGVHTASAYGHINRSFSIKKITGEARLRLGADHITTTLYKHTKPTHYFIPNYEIHGRTTYKLASNINLAVQLGHSQTPQLLPYTLFATRATGVQQFTRQVGFERPLMQSSALTAINWSKGISFSRISFIANRTWNGATFFGELNRFIWLNVDSISSQANHHYNIQYNGNWNWNPQKLHLHLHAGAYLIERIYNFEQKLYKGNFQMIHGGANISKNFRDKWILKYDTRINLLRNVLPEVFKGSFETLTADFNNEFNLRYNISKTFSVKSSSFIYLVNGFTQQQRSFYFADAEAQWTPKDKKWSYGLRWENILNEKAFFRVQNTALSQSFISLTFVPSNFLATIRYEF